MPTASPKAVEAYEAEREAILATAAKCRHCKSAKTRTKSETAMCKKHKLSSHLAYVCSPVSETYWCS